MFSISHIRRSRNDASLEAAHIILWCMHNWYDPDDKISKNKKILIAHNTRFTFYAPSFMRGVINFEASNTLLVLIS